MFVQFPNRVIHQSVCSDTDLFLSFSTWWQADFVDSEDSDLFADQSLFTWTTDGLNSTTDVDSSELIVWSASLVLVQSWFADTDYRVDCWLTNTAQIRAWTILLTIAESSCHSLGRSFLATTVRAFCSRAALSVLCAGDILFQAVDAQEHVTVFGCVGAWFVYVTLLWIISRGDHLFDFLVNIKAGTFLLRIVLGGDELLGRDTNHQENPQKEYFVCESHISA